MGSLSNDNREQDCLDVAMKVMKATDEEVCLSDEEKALLADSRTQDDLRLLVSAERSLLESNVSVPDAGGELERIVGEELPSDTDHRSARAVSMRHYALGALIGAAATLLAIFGFSQWEMLTPQNKQIAHVEKSSAGAGVKTVSTGSGETITLNLSDGTSITLNAGSRLDYPSHFNGDTRSVRLQGEALFKVSKDKAHPFIVLTDKMTTRVLGTIFNIKAYAGQRATVVLVEGSIEISSGSLTKKLRPGERAAVGNDGNIVMDRVNAEETTAWSDNQFYFDDQRLEDIMDDLGRWYNLMVVYKADSLKDLRLNFATPRNGSADDAIELLNSMRRFKVVKEGKKIVVE